MVSVSTNTMTVKGEVNYDALDGMWSIEGSIEGDIVAGCGGSLELATYSFSQAVLEYEKWKQENEP